MSDAQALTPQQTFQENLKSRIRDDIGKLLPDEVLASMVQQAVKEIFFTPMRVPKPGRPSYSDEMVNAPSWFHDQIMREAEPLLKAAVVEALAEHQTTIKAALWEALNNDKLIFVVAEVIGIRVREGFAGVAREFVTEMQNKGILRW